MKAKVLVGLLSTAFLVSCGSLKGDKRAALDAKFGAKLAEAGLTVVDTTFTPQQRLFEKGVGALTTDSAGDYYCVSYGVSGDKEGRFLTRKLQDPDVVTLAQKWLERTTPLKGQDSIAFNVAAQKHLGDFKVEKPIIAPVQKSNKQYAVYLVKGTDGKNHIAGVLKKKNGTVRSKVTSYPVNGRNY